MKLKSSVDVEKPKSPEYTITETYFEDSISKFALKTPGLGNIPTKPIKKTNPVSRDQ